MPETFKLLTKQLQGLGLTMSAIDEKGKVEDINTYTAVSDEEFKQNENTSALSSFNDFDIASEDEEDNY